MEADKAKAEQLAKGQCAEVTQGETMTIPTADGDGVCYTLKFDESQDETVYKIAADATVKGVSIHAQHLPTEFEKTKHYLKDKDGEDIEPIAQTGMEFVSVACTADGNG